MYYYQIDKSCIGRVPESVTIANSSTEGIGALSSWSCPLSTTTQSSCVKSSTSNKTTSLITIDLSQLLQPNFHYKLWVVLGNPAGDVIADNYISFSKSDTFTYWCMQKLAHAYIQVCIRRKPAVDVSTAILISL